MTEQSKIFEDHYQDYCKQIADVDFASIKNRLYIVCKKDMAYIPFFGQTYEVSGNGIFNEKGHKADYVTCVILSKYILLCPDQLHLDAEWCTFRDFKRVSHFTNTNIFNSETTQKIVTHFTGRLPELKSACEKMNGADQQMDNTYDLSVSFTVLPRLSLLLLMNDKDDDFPATCKVLFQKQAEYYLDPESLAMTSGLLAKKLIQM